VSQELKVLMLGGCLLLLDLKLLPLKLVLTSLNLSECSYVILSLSLQLSLLPLLSLDQPLKNSHHGWV
jgi:hypothetical protein